jgi:PAS domain S-box-containing protein
MSGAEPTTILNVDDDEAGRYTITQMLRKASFRVLEAGSGAEALRRAAEADLIVLDVNLPDLHGFEVCRRLKANPATASIPVLHLSGSFVTSGDRARGLDEGGDAYLTKPVEPAELIATVRALLRVRRAERALRENEARLRLLLEQVPAILWTTDTQLQITSSVGAGMTTHGMRPNETVGRSLTDLLGTSDPNHLPLAAHYRALAGEPAVYEMQWRGRSYQVRIDPLRDTAGRITGCVGVAFDFTERHQAEQALRQSHALLHAVVEGTTDTVYVKDQQGKYLLINSAGARTMGKSPSEVLGRDVTQLLEPESAARILEEDSQVMTSGQAQTFEQTVTIAGVTRTFLTTKAPYRDGSGQIIGVLGISRDISERKRLEEQLRQAQKMEAIGRLAGGVAHDFNNLLTAIIGYGDLILMDCPEPDQPLARNAAEIKRAAERAASLTRQLLAYSRQQILAARVLDLNTIVADMEKLLRRLIGEHIDLVTRLDRTLRRTFADPGQLEQVVLNLVLNARDAMPHGGRITITTSNVELDESYAWQHVDVEPGAYVRLTVSDTGCGMDEHVRAHLFEPFFTTKEVGKGTGLGLATIFGIVKQSGGHIDVQSAPGQGTTFNVYLPQVLEHMPKAPREAPATQPLHGTETVLLAEDEETVRTLVLSVLRRHGYTVLEARHGLDAVHICEEHPGPIHLLITDVVMPSLNGRELYQRLLGLRPALKVVYISGYPGDAVDLHGLQDKGASFLPKPFKPDALVRTVRELLDR